MISLNYKNLFFVICMFIPFTFIAGIFVTEVSVFILTIYFLIKNRNFDYFRDKLILCFIIFAIYIAVVAIFKIDHIDLKISSIFYFRYILFALSIYYLLEIPKKELIEIKNILSIIFLLFLFIFFDSFYQFFVGKNLFSYEIINLRISSIFGEELILGSFLIKTLPILLWFIFYFKFDMEKHRLFLIIFFSFFLITIYLSGGRTSFALMLLLVFLIIFFLKPLKKIFIYSLITLVLFISLTSSSKFGKSDIFNRMVKKSFNQITNNFFLEGDNMVFTQEKLSDSKKKIKKNLKLFSSDHQGHYELALNLFSQNPIVGVGAKGFRFHCRKINYYSEIGICSTHPHNTAIQLLSETGFLGFLSYAIFLFFIIFNFFRFLKKNSEFNKKNGFLVISIGLLIYLFPFLPSGNFFNNWSSIILFYYVGFYLYSYNNLKKE